MEMRKTEFHGVCVIEKIGGGIVGLACTSRIAKKLPQTTSRVIGDKASKTYWFNTIPESQAFYNNTAAKIEKGVTA
jgi:hypothetical protein